MKWVGRRRSRRSIILTIIYILTSSHPTALDFIENIRFCKSLTDTEEKEKESEGDIGLEAITRIVLALTEGSIEEVDEKWE